MSTQNNFEHIPQEKFAFVNDGERLHDKKLDDKPIGYLKDAWLRFRKSHAAVVAAVIIILIMLFAVLAPVLIRSHDSQFMVSTYAKKPPRIKLLQELGINTGCASRDFSEKSLIKTMALGVAAEGWDGSVVSLKDSMESEYQPILEITDERVTIGADKKESLSFTAQLENYLEVGFMYRTIEQSEYAKIVAWEQETGLHVLYPLINDNEFNMDATDANYWYKSVKGTPVKTDANGKVVKRTGLVAGGAAAGRVELFREMTDFRRAGEIEGVCIDPVTQDLLVLNNRGTQIILGMSQGPFKDEGYTKEIHEVYIYEKIK